MAEVQPPSTPDPTLDDSLAGIDATFDSLDPTLTPDAASTPDATPADPTDPSDPSTTDALLPDNAFNDPINLDDQAAIDELLKQANFDDPGLLSEAAPLVETAPLELPNFQQVMQDAQVSSIDLLRDVELNVKIELGRSRMLVEDVLKLAEGSVVELDKLAGDPVDVFVNERLVARGEVLVLNDNFCVRVNEIISGVKEEGL